MNTHAQSLSHVWLFATSWTIDHQAPLSMGFPRQEYWSGLPLPSPGDLPDPGIKLISPASVCCVGRQILYRLSHLRSPALTECVEKKRSCCSFKLSLVKGATCFLLPALRFFHVSWVTTLTQWSLMPFQELISQWRTPQSDHPGNKCFHVNNSLSEHLGLRPSTFNNSEITC